MLILHTLCLLTLCAAVKASFYSIELYSDSNCNDLITSQGASFSKNGCVSQSGVNSIRVTGLSDAMIHTWAHANCNHNEWTVPAACPGGSTCIKAPGTNSYGFQVGCI
ncbi:hypothetical protein M422DRAFT_45623 [Sphaerobolus stellatus SS14]|uniref:Uncharacterized protein n=1 Tax=Sphaerobolus stellatus (strain SS14) TaxID=990650 RepID=A0A0C9W5W8_SPHS4|nr:hypothetical protein M422DRAFT_45623 [Sphaerobolus stellatus SS14]